MAQSRAQYDSMVASHARANNVPEALVHRVIVRESKYHPGLVGRGGTIGLMQIKLPTARGLGYTGDAAGLRDPDTNLAWGVKYLAGAYRAAERRSQPRRALLCERLLLRRKAPAARTRRMPDGSRARAEIVAASERRSVRAKARGKRSRMAGVAPQVPCAG